MARLPPRGARGAGAAVPAQFEPFAAQGLAPARIAREDRDAYLVFAEAGELAARLAGRLRHEAAARSDLPVAGDRVAVRPRLEEGTATIQARLVTGERHVSLDPAQAEVPAEPGHHPREVHVRRQDLLAGLGAGDLPGEGARSPAPRARPPARCGPTMAAAGTRPPGASSACSRAAAS